MNDFLTPNVIAVLVGLIVSNFIGWAVYVSMTMSQIKKSFGYMNSKLSIIDWEKVPKKNLNDVFK